MFLLYSNSFGRKKQYIKPKTLHNMSLANTNALLKQLITKYLEIVTKLNQIYAERINDLMNQQQKIQKQINQLFLTQYVWIIYVFD